MPLAFVYFMLYISDMATKKTSSRKITKKEETAPKTRKRVKTTRPVKNEVVQEELHTEARTVVSQPAAVSPTKKEREINKTGVAIFAVIIILGLLYFFRSAFVVAMINGQPISRSEFNHTLEKDAGKQALSEIVTRTLIYQEANKNHINVSDQYIAGEIKKIEDQLKKSGQSLDSALKTRGLTREDLADQIKIKKIVDELVGKKITVTDKDVNDFIEKNKDQLPDNEKDNPSKATKDSVKQRLQSEKLSQKFQEWIDNLQKKAKINKFINI